MNNRKSFTITNKSSLLKIFLGLFMSLLIFITAIALGTFIKGWAATTSVVIPSILLEVIIGAAASVPIGFDPFAGAIIAALGNLVPAPLLLTSFDVIVRKWTWLGKKLKKADKLSVKYGKYGVWMLAPLAPFIGVYVGVAVGITLRFRPLLIFMSLSLSVIIAALVTTYGGDGIKNLLTASL